MNLHGFGAVGLPWAFDAGGVTTDLATSVPPADDDRSRRVSRRVMLGGLAGGSVAVAGGAAGLRWAVDRAAGSGSATTPAPNPSAVASAAAVVEAARRRSGRTQTVDLVARRAQVDLGGTVVTAMTYGGVLPGALVRVGAGDVLRARIRNELDQPTSVHWHGLALRNDADGVPEVTGGEVAAGGTGTVEFVVPDDPGTYWFHPHTGLQLDWGLHAPLVVEDSNEPGGYDHELVVVLDDWTVGIGKTPELLLADLMAGKGATGMGGMSGMGMGGSGGMGSMSDSGDVDYPAYLANGRLASDPTSLAARPGQRVRIRLVNAAADTVFDVALADHQLTVTHSDGFPVVPVRTEVLRIAMGERYDATVTLADGVFPLVAAPVGKTGTAPRVIVRTGSGPVPAADVRPAELNGQILTVDQLVAADAVRLTDRDPETVQQVMLGGHHGRLPVDHQRHRL